MPPSVGQNLKFLIFEKIRESGQVTDVDLVGELTRNGVEVTQRELNKILLHLEINGLITVRWVGKDRRRIEAIQPKVKEVPGTV